MNDDNSPWEYKPDGQTVSQPPELSSSTAEGSSHSGSAKDVSVSWTASEYIDHSRGPAWYLTLITGTALLAVGIYFITKDYFASGVIVMVGVIVGVFST